MNLYYVAQKAEQSGKKEGERSEVEHEGHFPLGTVVTLLDDKGAPRGRIQAIVPVPAIEFVHCLNKIDFYLIEWKVSAQF